jgi:hypothetical protein
VEHIARLVGHSGTMTTETVYRKQIRPVLLDGADVMDRIFPLAARVTAVPIRSSWTNITGRSLVGLPVRR